MKKILFLTLVLIPLFINAQISDDFEDGDISGWTESSVGHWEASTTLPINGTYSLRQVYDETVTGNYHDQISHPFGNIDLSLGDVTWRFQTKYTYNPSGSNTWSAYLFADADASQMFPGGTINGYLLGINLTDTKDSIKLCKVDGGVVSEIINTEFDWQDNITTSGVAGFEIIRTPTGDWSIFIDDNGGFDNLVQIGTVNNSDFTTASYFGFSYKYTASADMKLWFDDLSLTGTAGNDITSQITLGVSTEPTSISSLTDTQGESTFVFDFTLEDLASADVLPTIIDQIKIIQGTNNEIVDWTNVIAGASISGDDITGELIGTVNSDNITFASNDFITIASGTNETYILKIWLKSDLSNISDNDNLDFKLLYSNIICDAAGSSFGSGDIESGAEAINIEATKLFYVTTPTIVGINSDFLISVAATDENNNVDTDYTSLLTLSKESGTGILSSASGLSQNMVLGEASWSDLQYDTEESFSISTTSGSFPIITTNDIQCLNITYFINDDFEDADITDWTESSVGHWEASTTLPINGVNSLRQVFDNTLADHDQISHSLGAIDLDAGITTWRFQTKYAYDPSGDNTWTTFLFADADASQMFSGGAINGYVIGVNFTGSSDEIQLWKITNGSATSILNTNYNWQDNITAAGVAGFEINRATTGDWEIKIDDNGGFDNLVQIGTVNNSDFINASYFGFSYKYTASADMKLWFDDVIVTGKVGNDKDSQVSAGTATEPVSISSLADSQVNSTNVFDVNFADISTVDTEPTIIDQIVFTQGTNNDVADWTDAIAGAVLTGDDISGELVGTIDNDSIIFSGNDFISIANGTNETYTLKVWLKPDLSNVSDNDKLDFKLLYSNITCDFAGSSFGSGNIESGAEFIDIEATQLKFVTIPSIVAVGVDFSIGVSAIDVNNNIDTDYSNTISLVKASGTGNLSSISGVTQSFVNGIANWTDLQYDLVETFSVSASSGSFPNITSNDIECQTTIIYLNDDFEDNDIAGWQESTFGHWASSIDNPINGNYSLKQTFDNSSSDIDVISHPLNSVDLNNGTKAWRFQVRYDNPAPSGNNNWSVFLMADNDETEMFPSGNVNGYLIGINFSGSDDIVKLSKVTNGTETIIINTNYDWNTINSSEAKGFEVLRQTDGTWEIKIDEDGGFDNLQSYGTANDVTYTTANYFGIYYKYSSTQDQKLWIDDVYFGAEIPDLDAPVLNTLEVISPNSLQLTFNENLNQTTAETLINYSVNNSIGNPNLANLNATNHKVVNIQFANDFVDNLQNELTIENLEDESSNSIATTIKTFTWKNIDAISVSALTDSTLDVLFSKDVSVATATSLTNYLINNSIGNPSIAELDNLNAKLVHLKFTNKFVQEQAYSINIANVNDVYGNVMIAKDISFVYYHPNPYDIVVNEIMFDANPAPPALPVYEYIEIYNNSNFVINLSGWTISIGGKEHLFTDSIIQANGFAILCEEQATQDFVSLGMPLGILDNSELTITGKRILIKDKDANIIEDITYSPDWHTDTEHSSGGFSIERIDPANLCGEEQNWATTVNIPMGGTPGSQNSVFASNPDTSKPTVVSVEYISSKELKVSFSEKLEKTIAETIANYTIGSVNPISATVSLETTSVINLSFTDNFNEGTNSLVIKNIEDNCGNIIDDYTYNFNYQLLYPKTIEVISENQLRLHFSENVEVYSAQTQVNYLVDNGIGNPSVALINNADSTTVTLLFDNNFTLEQSYTLTVTNIKDVNENVMNTEDINFVYYIAKPFDIVINEIMCDINPAPVAVPEAFYVELYNTSDFDIDLTDWEFISEGQTQRNFPYITLKSNEYLILCELDEASLFSSYDNVLPLLSSQDIIGSGRNLKLVSSNGTVVEEINYSPDWYNDEDKDNGGWSLERIDPTNFCGEETNWKASKSAYGGTPGTKNSVFNSNQDNTAPDLLNVQLISSNYLLLEFSENINYASGNDTLNYSVNNGINYPHEAIVDTENRQFVHLHFTNQFSDGIENTLLIENIKDNCDNTTSTTAYDFTYNLISPTELWVKDDKHLKIKFSETIDLISGTDNNNFIVDNSVGHPVYVARETSDTTIIYLEFADAFPNGEDLTITISGIKDVNGNEMETTDLPFSYYTPKKDDIIINELLFHPNSGGSEFVEFYNRSDKKIDLVNLKFATWDEDENIIKSITDLSATNMYFEPKTYLAFAKNKKGVLTYYMSKNQENIIELPNFPSLSDKSGKVLLLHGDTTVIDEFNYSEEMHFQLLDSETGVSLERVNFEKPTQDENNWHSASEYVGFATPAYKNSQYSEGVNPGDKPVVVEPYMFSPDNDGIEDYANINYKFENPGHVATVIIFDAKGRIVNELANNKLLSTQGTIVWNGLYENNNLAPAGTYLIYFKVYDLDGNIDLYKIPVVSARKF